MELITREEYMTRLRRLPIKNPTPEDMAIVCPHLTPEQAVEAFTSEEGNGYVACPPVLIKNGFQVVLFGEGWEDKVWGKTYPPALRSAFASRTLKSYKDGKPHGDVFTKSQYMDEAMVYAAKRWEDHLILDDWVSCINFYVQDPSDLNERQSPKTKAVVYVTTNRGWSDIINDHSKPESQMIDEALVIVTLDPFEGCEIKGGRGSYTESNCAYCGAGLGLTGCNGCGFSFSDDHMRCGWSTPLPSKIVALLEEHGHVFKKDPHEAWAKERERWQRYRARV